MATPGPAKPPGPSKFAPTPTTPPPPPPGSIKPSDPWKFPSKFPWKFPSKLGGGPLLSGGP